ncbi:MAG TPA: bifunctional transaldolase/phosoglucose isomerase [Terriglobia bacterium]|nr:bifunctional transaldolase/phosoglucose isomerase [Terriglobia bacterium]
MTQNPLRELNKLGQSVWQDYIRRGELISGEFKRLIDEDGISGVTSNPSIFEKAITGSKDYDDGIRKYVDKGLQGARLFEQLAVEDIQMACDLLRPTYDATQGGDGFVSIEVSPKLARDTQASLEEARRLWKSVNRPNLLVKIPGTKEGLPAIEQCLVEGININITLLFAVERYVEVAEAYIRALEKRAAQGKPIDRIASVASFFVSRIDTLVDKLLDGKLAKEIVPEQRTKIDQLHGKAAIANAKNAYQEYKRLFLSPRFKALATKGARSQRVLWASTSTKNPKYRDVIYVETLIGSETVNTMPPATVVAFRDHGVARPTLEENMEGARKELAGLAQAGIDLAAVTQQLEDEGIVLFDEAYDKLLKGLKEKRDKIVSIAVDPSSASLGKLQMAVDASLADLDQRNFSRRLAARDASLWKDDPGHQKIIKNALGWLSVSEAMWEQSGNLLEFVDSVRKEGYTHAVVLGMGGSSLCPDVCRETFGTREGYLALEVLDSTVPATIIHMEKSLNLEKTLFLVSSKSGGTTETLSFYKHFRDRLNKLKGERAGENFVAITDPGTSLEKLAKEQRFRRVFPGVPDIGGRYSALSNFGMVPAALAGVDIRQLLQQAERMVHATAAGASAKDSPGLVLGTILAEAAKAGRDKATFFLSPGIRTFGDWVEQLIAESTGKEGKGILPVVRETIGAPEVYGDDRLFIQFQLASEARERIEPKMEALKAAGHPLVTFTLHDAMDLGQEFFRWEVGTACAGSLLGIDAFDQPNVQESKDNTNRLLAEFNSTGKLPEGEAAIASGELKMYCDAATKSHLEKLTPNGNGSASSLESLLAGFLHQAKAGDYVALMAYLEPASAYKALLQAVRMQIRDALRVATTLGYGPRFLHSTGQLHKGGPANGIFLQITCDDTEDLPVPGEPYTFSVLKRAQALGDLQSLQSRNRRVIRIHLGEKVKSGLDQLLKAVESAVSTSRGAVA